MDNSFLTTESINPKTLNIDRMATDEILRVINKEDQKVTEAIAEVIPDITQVVDVIVKVISFGGRVFFIGSGTSGRLGVLEAAECPPTFGVSQDLFQAVISGGEKSVFSAVESAEDDFEQGKKDLESRNLSDKDFVIGITASGKTPYVMGAVKFAKQMGAKAAVLTCNKNSLVGELCDFRIEALSGPEVIGGSTRMKAGSTQKMILNMITTTAMIQLGKVYQNLMVDLHISNEKLHQRGINIIHLATGVDKVQAEKTLKKANGSVKAAIVMIKNSVDLATALKQLDESGGYVRKTIK